MPTFGETGDDDDSQSTVEDNIVGGQFTCPHDCLALSITAKIVVTTATHKVKCAIYDSNKVLIGETEEKSVEVQAADWVTFKFTTTPGLAAGMNYHLCIWAESTGGTAQIRHQGAGTGTAGYDSETYNDFPDPWDLTATTNLVHVYCTYIRTGGWNYRRGTIQEVLNMLSTLNVKAEQLNYWWDDGTNAIAVFPKRK